jgi:hypothetical protein
MTVAVELAVWEHSALGFVCTAEIKELGDIKLSTEV